MRNIKWLSLLLALCLLAAMLPTVAEEDVFAAPVDEEVAEIEIEVPEDDVPEPAPLAPPETAAAVNLPSRTVVNAFDLPGNDDLFAGYVQGVLYPKSVANERLISGDQLDGIAGLAYDLLSEKIAQVAAGELESTEFTFTREQLGIPDSYTFAELGVTDYSAAFTAAHQQITASMNQELLIHTLLADHPYELYWFDKTSGTRFGAFSFSYTGGDSITVSGDMEIKMPVAQGYSVEGAVGTYRFNTAIGRAVQTTVTTAKSVVKQNASKTSLEKLEAYRDWICEAVSYNYDALGGVPYGDPWQLIWVFDGDPDTKVVCEGYSKAFQYLCDLSDLPNIWCYTVTGRMGRTRETGGNHMWNIVRMDDGRNYLVDVTNSDTGTVGQRGQLFLAPYAGGSLSEGYDLAVINYYYDEDTLGLFSTSQLTLSATEYAGPGDVAPTATRAPRTTPSPTPAPTPTVEPQPTSTTIIGPVSIRDCDIAAIADKTYTGKAIKPNPVVEFMGIRLEKGADYTLKYANNKAIGKATVTITGKGFFTGTKKITFKINPKAVALSKLTAGKKKLTVKWKKGAGGAGYQLQYATKKDFTGKKTVTVAKTATTSKTIKSLKSGKTYYVRIRAYKKAGGKTYVSKWSKVLSKKVK